MPQVRQYRKQKPSTVFASETYTDVQEHDNDVYHVNLYLNRDPTVLVGEAIFVKDQEMCSLFKVRVHKQFQNTGLGNRLNEEVLEATKDAGCTCLDGAITNPKQVEIRSRWEGTKFWYPDDPARRIRALSKDEALDALECSGEGHCAARIYTTTPVSPSGCRKCYHVHECLDKFDNKIMETPYA